MFDEGHFGGRGAGFLQHLDHLLQFAHARIIVLLGGLAQHGLDDLDDFLREAFQVGARGVLDVVLGEDLLDETLRLFVARLELAVDLVGELQQFLADGFQFGLLVARGLFDLVREQLEEVVIHAAARK